MFDIRMDREHTISSLDFVRKWMETESGRKDVYLNVFKRQQGQHVSCDEDNPEQNDKSRHTSSCRLQSGSSIGYQNHSVPDLKWIISQVYYWKVLCFANVDLVKSKVESPDVVYDALWKV